MTCPHHNFQILCEELAPHVLTQHRVCLTCGDRKFLHSRYVGRGFKTPDHDQARTIVTAAAASSTNRVRAFRERKRTLTLSARH